MALKDDPVAAARMPVCAVVVTYEPRVDALQGVRALAPQVDHLVVVDNGSGAASEAYFAGLPVQAQVLRLGDNLGVGAGHNAGIARARELGARYVLLMDQDSVPESDMVERLVEGDERLRGEGCRVGAVGPVYFDQRVGKSWPFYRLEGFGVRGHECGDAPQVACDFLISSGTLVRLDVLDEVGPMPEGYFLEHVDTEWCLRARHRGYELFGICAARMLHALGDDAVDVPLIGRRVQVYRPYRHYYLFRNAVLLARAPHAPARWCWHELLRLAKRFAFFGLLVPPRLPRVGWMLKGAWHGLRGLEGRIDRPAAQRRL